MMLGYEGYKEIKRKKRLEEKRRRVVKKFDLAILKKTF